MNNTVLHAKRSAVHVPNLPAPSRRTLAMWCAGVLTLAVAVGMAASAPAPPDTSTISFSTPETTVTGTVRDPQGQPVAGAGVTEYQTDRAYLTDAHGSFTSAFPVSATKRYFTAVHKQRALVGYGFLAAGGQNVEVRMEPAHLLSGTVLDAKGQPVAGAQVAPLTATSFYVLTDAQGRFDLGWPSEEERRFQKVFLIARQPRRSLATWLELPAKAKSIVIKAAPGLALIGSVEDPNGKPIPGAKVSLTLVRDGEMATSLEPVVTDAGGRYSFSALPHQQEFKLTARAPGYGPGLATTGRINNLNPAATVESIVLKPADSSVSGRVIDVDGAPVEGASVTVNGKGQPDHAALTNAQGRFTLGQICEGSFTVDATKTIGNQNRQLLTGYVQNVAADSKDVEIVVFPWPYARAGREESPFTADAQTGVLKYRWGHQGWRLLEGKGFRDIPMTAEKPPGVRIKPPVNAPALFGKWRSPAVKGGFRWIAVMRAHPRGLYDQLVIDANGDGNLDNDPVVTASAASQPSPTNTLTAFGPVKVSLDVPDGPSMAHLGFAFYHSTMTLSAGTDGWFEGNVDIGGVKTRCLLADKNADGTFDTQSFDPSQCDLIGFQVGSNMTVHAVGPYIMLEKRLYHLNLNRCTNSMQVSVTPATNVPFAWISVPRNITALRVQGKNGSFTLHPELGKARLPVGTYQLDYWMIERLDQEGTAWTLKGSADSALAAFKLAAGGTTRLRIGEPAVAQIEQHYKTGMNWNFREPKLVGQLGESVTVSKKEGVAPLGLRIRNPQMGYDRTFTFEYG